MNSIRNLVETPHPIYKRYKETWDFYLNSYEGGVDYTGALITGKQGLLDSVFNAIQIFVSGKPYNPIAYGNLFQHPKERSVDFKRRVEMSFYYNFCAPVIEVYVNHLFKQPVIEDFGSVDYQVRTQYENIDAKGTSVQEFRQNMAELAQIYGHVFVLVDMPSNDKPIFSMQDKIDYEQFPYSSFYPPQSVINWALDKQGKPYWVLLEEKEDVNVDHTSYDYRRLQKKNYRVWTRQEWITYDAEYNETWRGSHMLGQVPITCVYDRQSKKVASFLGVSALADISFIARDVYNSCSELKQILGDQTFAFLALQGMAGDYNEIELGTGKGILYPPDRNVPQYVSPPPGNAEVYFQHIDKQIRKIFQLAKLEGGSASQEQVATIQSGVSKAWDFNETNAALAKRAAALEDGENKIWQDFARWEGVEFDGSVQYPREFSVQSLASDMSEAEQAMRLDLGRQFEVEVKKSIIKKKFSRMPIDEVEKMCDEMEQRVGKGESGRLLDRLSPTYLAKFRETTPTRR